MDMTDFENKPKLSADDYRICVRHIFANLHKQNQEYTFRIVEVTAESDINFALKMYLISCHSENTSPFLILHGHGDADHGYCLGDGFYLSLDKFCHILIKHFKKYYIAGMVARVLVAICHGHNFNDCFKSSSMVGPLLVYSITNESNPVTEIKADFNDSNIITRANHPDLVAKFAEILCHSSPLIFTTISPPSLPSLLFPLSFFLSYNFLSSNISPLSPSFFPPSHLRVSPLHPPLSLDLYPIISYHFALPVTSSEICDVTVIVKFNKSQAMIVSLLT